MNYVIITMILSLSMYASEIDRMEAIVQDIEHLRSDYNKCMKELELVRTQDIQPENPTEYKKLLEKQRLKNKTLTVKIEALNKNLDSKKEAILNIDKANTKYEKLLLAKEKEYNLKLENKDNTIELLKIKINDSQKNNIKSQELVKKIVICKDENPFPTLIMKESTKPKESKLIELETSSKALVYRLNKMSDIYSDLSTNTVVDTWEDQTSFTSNAMSQSWVKITGYFNDGIWEKARKNLWIKKINTIQRVNVKKQ